MLVLGLISAILEIKAIALGFGSVSFEFKGSLGSILLHLRGVWGLLLHLRGIWGLSKPGVEQEGEI